jgi:hypothetical protein
MRTSLVFLAPPFLHATLKTRVRQYISVGLGEGGANTSVADGPWAGELHKKLVWFKSFLICHRVTLTHCCWVLEVKKRAMFRPAMDPKFDFQSRYTFYEFCFLVSI